MLHGLAAEPPQSLLLLLSQSSSTSHPRVSESLGASTAGAWGSRRGSGGKQALHFHPSLNKWFPFIYSCLCNMKTWDKQAGQTFLLELQFIFLSSPSSSPGGKAVGKYKLNQVYQRTSFSTFSRANTAGFLVVPPSLFDIYFGKNLRNPVANENPAGFIHAKWLWVFLELKKNQF